MIVFVVGTKAQFIKMAPLILAARAAGRSHTVVETGQHCETFDDLRMDFGLPPPDLRLVESGEADTRLSFAAWLRASVRRVRTGALQAIDDGRDATYVVHGDTASALLGAWAGRRRGHRVAHVEAGLRSFSYLHPFPEEAIRVAVSRRSDLHFCPDVASEANLRRAAVRGTVYRTAGNTLKDSLRMAVRVAGDQRHADAPYAIFSTHRHENLFSRKRLAEVLDILRRTVRMIPVKFVLHPVTARRLRDLRLLDELATLPQLELVPRMGFFEFVALLRGARVVLTDGGSNQEECAMLGIPCVLLRKATERNDGLGSTTILSHYDWDIVAQTLDRLPTDRPARDDLFEGPSPSAQIVDAIASLGRAH